MTQPTPRQQKVHTLLHLLQEFSSILLLIGVVLLVLLVPAVPLLGLSIIVVKLWPIQQEAAAVVTLAALLYFVLIAWPMYRSFYIEVILPELPTFRMKPEAVEKPKPVMTFEEEQRLNQAVYDTRNEF